LGDTLERLAKQKDVEALRTYITELRSYLDRVQLIVPA